MLPRVKHVTALAAIAFTATALAGCTAAAPPMAVQVQKTAPPNLKPSATPTPKPVPSETPEDPCSSARPSISLMQDGKNGGNGFNPDGGPITGLFEGELVDLGPRAFAQGTVNLNEAGEVVSYTVAAGDVYELVYERFCFSDYYDVISYNGGLEPMRSRPAFKGIEPGDVLILRPDPSVVWVPHAD
ncbi:hypothetical protein [Microbacterium sp. H1-D42]|uniref:hypothetical protein n=1 Tax=Microbacterium sp. H1-D42 TaxID=2925844 RepID=UPI001F538F8F|nr:hypothetical protein [Microbacterium sp. H1-D42]UNK71892.1 hypothetical protein MNR00_05405 [Microbacterium sp. H1-D42]